MDVAGAIMREELRKRIEDYLPTKDRFTGATNVFDFDGALFRDLWQKRPGSPFLSYVRYHISDHRPLWAEFRT